MALARRWIRPLQSLSRVLQSPHQNANVLSQHRTIQQSAPRLDSYEGDGKTTVTMLDNELAKYLIIESYNEHGFHLSNDSFAYGPIILFPNVIFQWKVKTIDDINSDSLTLFKLIEPKLDLLLIGIGEPRFWTAESMMRLRKEVKSSGVKAEIMATRDAVATYNFMLDDFRVVAGAFLPTISKAEKTMLHLTKDTPQASITES